MIHRRWLAALVVVAVTAGPLLTAPASAAPLDTWPITHGIDCVNDVYNPIRPDGTRAPDGDPVPGTPEWNKRSADNIACTKQRDSDKRYQPWDRQNATRYGEDWYRQPVRFDQRRFRWDYMPAYSIPGVPAAEIYRPCAPQTCLNIEPGLERIAPPYPVVVIFHGFIAQKTHHRFNAQAFAEAGYMAITVNGIHPVSGAPNVQDSANGGEVLDWLASPASGVFGREADLSRVVFAGHSQGSGAALSYQDDPRVHAIIAWDGGDSIRDDNHDKPIMYQRTDGAFSAPQTTTARTDYPETRNRGLQTYLTHKERGLDVMHLTLRDTSHVDWNGYGVGLAGNRLAELVINYYSLAWLDRHAKGKLVFDGEGAVVPSAGRTEAQERAYRQSVANDAFQRLTAKRFDNSADRHNISMGFFDPVQLATSGDPLYGGNVPYRVEGLWTTDRLSWFFRSYCSVSVPDYVNGSDGRPHSAVAARADSGAEGDMRINGCPEVPVS
ncbi:MAG TPA: hypothetical protein VM840_09540 [Actinomycetota bacterium]|nr:hypothetical protein [Actinomycetota bacterium]